MIDIKTDRRTETTNTNRTDAQRSEYLQPQHQRLVELAPLFRRVRQYKSLTSSTDMVQWWWWWRRCCFEGQQVRWLSAGNTVMTRVTYITIQPCTRTQTRTWTRGGTVELVIICGKTDEIVHAEGRVGLIHLPEQPPEHPLITPQDFLLESSVHIHHKTFRIGTVGT